MPDVKFSDAKNNLEDLKKLGVRMVDFTGGEPLLNKELPKILSYAKHLGFFVKLSTNGFLYPEKAEEIKGLSNRIYFSLDTISEDEYKKIRGIDGFEKVMEGVKIARKLKQDSCILYTVTNENLHNISNIAKFCKENRLTLYIHPCFSYFENEALNIKNIEKIKKYFWHPYVRMSLPQLDFHSKGGNDINNPSCMAGIATVDIGPDDCLTIPCFHKHIKRVKIDGKLYSLYNSDEWKDLFKDVGSYDFCRNCTIDCYFGLSYLDRIGRYFFRQNLTFFKSILENLRPH
jgi:MoaA/NifB/PqqE/SkfB family radical SAM enzyme